MGRSSEVTSPRAEASSVDMNQPCSVPVASVCSHEVQMSLGVAQGTAQLKEQLAAAVDAESRQLRWDLNPMGIFSRGS